MNCQHCQEEVYEEDKFCGNCGCNLSSDSIDKSGHHSNVSESYFASVIEFIKTIFKNPGNVIGSFNNFTISVATGVLSLMIILFSLLTLIQTRSFNYEIYISFTAFFEYALILVIVLAVYFGVAVLFLSVALKRRQLINYIFKDFIVISIFVTAIFILALMIGLFTLYEISTFLNIVATLLLITSPYYLYVKYSADHNEKFDGFYALILYLILASIVTLIIYRISFSYAVNSAINDMPIF